MHTQLPTIVSSMSIGAAMFHIPSMPIMVLKKPAVNKRDSAIVFIVLPFRLWGARGPPS